MLVTPLGENESDLSQSLLANEPLSDIKKLLENYDFIPVTIKDLAAYEDMF